jgi:hypothetical protein
MMWCKITGAIALVSLLSIGVANADTPDDKFISLVQAQGITGDRGQLIADGHAACDGYGSLAFVGQVSALMGRGMSNTQATGLQLAGLKTYCPEKIAGLPVP